MDEELKTLLTDRGVSSEAVAKMEEDKIDKFVISTADDDFLKMYLPHPGDRLAVQHFVKPENPTNTSKNKILKSLRRKLLLKRSNDISDSEIDNESQKAKPRKQLVGNKNAQKSTRKIEIGWLNFDVNSQTYRQVRKKRGGSTRKIDIMKEATRVDILSTAEKLFFPDGKSPIGNLTDFTSELRDFSEQPLLSNESVMNMYDTTGINILRFYLTTSPAEEDATFNLSTETFLSTPSTPPKSVDKSGMKDTEPSVWLVNDEDNSLPDLPQDLSETEVFFNPITVEDSLLDGTINDPGCVENFEIKIHRGPVGFSELLSYFKDPDILFKFLTVVRILPNGEREIAEDTSGVTRDLLSEFWAEFISKCTVGKDVKVPGLRHDFGVDEWMSVGRILVYGWINAGYWPVQISECFLLACMFDQREIESTMLLNDFNRSLSLQDRFVFEKALDDYDTVENDDLLEALECHDCKTLVTKENIKRVLLEIAHKELIQTPMFVCECWKDILRKTGLSKEKLRVLYMSLEPTSKGVTKLLKFDPDNVGLDVVKHLKRYIKELDVGGLKKFLRFCTGSDLLTVPQITIQFSQMRGLQRRPIGHTCGCVLELSDSYENFMEFRAEFDNVLQSNVWVMDIV